MNSNGHMTLNLKYPMKIIWFDFVSKQTLTFVYKKSGLDLRVKQIGETDKRNR